jgi:hypothetical protein
VPAPITTAAPAAASPITVPRRHPLLNIPGSLDLVQRCHPLDAPGTPSVAFSATEVAQRPARATPRTGQPGKQARADPAAPYAAPCPG